MGVKRMSSWDTEHKRDTWSDKKACTTWHSYSTATTRRLDVFVTQCGQIPSTIFYDRIMKQFEATDRVQSSDECAQSINIVTLLSFYKQLDYKKTAKLCFYLQQF